MWASFPDLLNPNFTEFANGHASTRAIRETKSTAKHKMYTVYLFPYCRPRGGWNVNLLTCVLRKQSMRGM